MLLKYDPLAIFAWWDKCALFNTNTGVLNLPDQSQNASYTPDGVDFDYKFISYYYITLSWISQYH